MMKTMLGCVMAGMLVSSVALGKAAARDVTGTLNLNTASRAELEKLPGVGPRRAKLIIDYRAQKAFEKPEEVRKVKGVGRGLFAKIKDHVSVQGPTTLSVSAASVKPTAPASLAKPLAPAKAKTQVNK